MIAKDNDLKIISKIFEFLAEGHDIYFILLISWSGFILFYFILSLLISWSDFILFYFILFYFKMDVQLKIIDFMERF